MTEIRQTQWIGIISTCSRLTISQLLLVAAAFMLSCEVDSSKPVTDEITLAWWLTVRFSPTGDQIAGLPVTEIDPTWLRASALDDLPLPSSGYASGDSLSDHGGMFSVNEDFDSDGAHETAIVGVYETRSGEFGRFLLILSRSPVAATTVRAKFLIPGVPGFSVLQRVGNQVFWGECMECDDYSHIKFQDRIFYLEHESCEDCG